MWSWIFRWLLFREGWNDIDHLEELTCMFQSRVFRSMDAK